MSEVSPAEGEADESNGADDGVRTRDLRLGKATL